MSLAVLTTEFGAPFKLNARAARLTDEQFAHLCQENPELRLELTAQGELIIMPPTGAETGWRSSEIIGPLYVWAKNDGTGLTFDSSTGFTLPNGAKRSPDAAWVRRERWSALSREQRAAFAPLCPDFVVELRSPTDALSVLQEKMQEYIDNGARLGWLIDPLEKRAYIYRPHQAVEIIDSPTTLSGEQVLPGFTLRVSELWEPPA